MANIFTSSIGKKLVMSLSGLFLILFLLFHASMNVVAIFSTEAYDMICAFLGANWYALVGTLVLAGGFMVHILYAFILTLKNMKARGKDAYAVTAMPASVKWASRNMFVLGLIVCGGILLHLFNFWYKMQFVEIAYGHAWETMGMADPTKGAALIQGLFSSPVYSALYLIWFGAIWFHLTHGFWSAFQTIGFSNSVWLPRLKFISNIFATLVMLMFAAVVIFFYVQSLCGGTCCLGH